MNQRIAPRSRITVDFLMPERDVLQRLCDADIRPAAEQIRWLVLLEAQRRGILPTTDATESHAGAVPTP